MKKQIQWREKERVEADYADSMRSLDVGRLEERVSSSEDKQKLLAEKKNQVTAGIEAKRGELRGLANDLIISHDIIEKDLQDQLRMLDDTCCALIIEAVAIVPNLTGDLKQETLVSDNSEMNRFFDLGVQAIGDRYEELVTQLVTPKDAHEMVELLDEVGELLNKPNLKRIPFADISQLTALQIQSQSKEVANQPIGFKRLLSLLYSEANLLWWKKYVSDEEHPAIPVWESERTKALADLKSIVTARRDLEKGKLDQFKGDQDRCKEAKNSKDRLLEIQAQLNRIHEIAHSLKQQKQELEAVDVEDNKLKSDLEALNPCICLLKEVESLSAEINVFSEDRRKFHSEITLYRVVDQLNKRLVHLEQMMRSFGVVIAKDEHKAIYVPLLEKIEQLKKVMTEKLNASVKEKFSYVDDAIKNLGKDIQDFVNDQSYF